MTCVLSMPALYTRPYTDSGATIQNNGCESFDFNWINPRPSHPGLSDNQKSSTPCHIEASTGSSIPCRMELSNEFSENVNYEPMNGDFRKDDKADITQNVSGEDFALIGSADESKEFDICKKTEAELRITCYPTSQGVKRKAEHSEPEETFIPLKRVSPFLNTPKERKDERKKILKISIKKLRQLSDPEFFLRRTVLVNNTTKRLQLELREEKRRNKRRKYRNGFGVPNSNCLSDMYLFEDPFLSEKITDDMTDTLIKNVLCDKTNDISEDSNVSEDSNKVSNAMEHQSSEQQCVDSRTFQPLSAIDENTFHSTSEGTKVLTELDKE